MYSIGHEGEPSAALTPDVRYHSGDGARTGTLRSPTEAALIQRFDDAFTNPSSETSAPLQDAALAFGHQARAIGLRPEQLVLRLKGLLFRHGDLAGKPSLYDDEGSHTSAARPIYGRVLSWSLDAYFADAAAQPGGA